MRLSSLVLLLLPSLAFGLMQVDKSPLKIKTPPPEFDLIKENESIAVFHEESVQKEEPESRHVVSFGAGQLSADRLTLASNGEVVDYDLSDRALFVGGGLGYYPTRWGGFLGLNGSVSYSFREQQNRVLASSLHLIATDILISYRHETSSRSWVKPFFGLGPGVNIVVQRGVDELNTSEAKGLLVGAVGLGFNLKRFFNLSSPIDWEMTAQYKRWFDLAPSNADYNGSVVGLGLSMLL